MTKVEVIKELLLAFTQADDNRFEKVLGAIADTNEILTAKLSLGGEYLTAKDCDYLQNILNEC